MLSSKVVLSLLTLYCLIDAVAAAALIARNTREINGLDHESLTHQGQHLEENLSMHGTENRESGTQVEIPFVTTQQSSTQNQNQFLYIRGKNEKRRKVIPLDSLGRFKF